MSPAASTRLYEEVLLLVQLTAFRLLSVKFIQVKNNKFSIFQFSCCAFSTTNVHLYINAVFMFHVVQVIQCVVLLICIHKYREEMIVAYCCSWCTICECAARK